MKIGDYVRYKTLSNQIKINKIKNIVEPDDSELSMTNIILYDLDNKDVTADKYIIKSSPNIIDLIEVGDLVYVDISPDDCGGIIVPRITETEKELNSLKLLIKNKDYILKSIITHEQIDSMEYKVKE